VSVSRWHIGFAEPSPTVDRVRSALDMNVAESPM
jgi:hypothetical protein